MALWLALAIAGLSSLLGFNANSEVGLFLVGLNLLALSMIFRPGWWTFWMPLGFWAQRATDVKSADRLGPVVAFVGWIVLAFNMVIAWKA